MSLKTWIAKEERRLEEQRILWDLTLPQEAYPAGDLLADPILREAALALAREVEQAQAAFARLSALMAQEQGAPLSPMPFGDLSVMLAPLYAERRGLHASQLLDAVHIYQDGKASEEYARRNLAAARQWASEEGR